MRTIPRQFHINLVLVTPHKKPNTVMGIYDDQTFDLKTRVYMWFRMDVVQVQYGTMDQMFHLMMLLVQYVTDITLSWNGVMCCIDSLFVYIQALYGTY